MKAYKQQFVTQLGEEEITVVIQASRRKSMRLAWSPAGQVDLRIPVGVPRSDVLTFLKKHESWLLQRRRDWLQARDASRGSMELVGETVQLVPWQGRGLKLEEGRLLVPAGSEQQQTDAIDRWLRQQAKELYQGLIDDWWPQFQQYAAAKPVLRIKRMRTRWGSLSTRGYINLNLALMHQPLDLIELVVVHELCHLAHFDHGPGFRRLMAHHLPDGRAREQQLNQVRLNGFQPTC